MVRSLVCWFAISLCTSACAESKESRCKAPPIELSTAQNAACGADAKVCDGWRRFRGRHPYPYQAIALDAKPGAGATLILSELPPVGSPAALNELVKVTLNVGDDAIRRLRYPIGLDGWLEDLTVSLPVDGGPTVPLALASGGVMQVSAALANRLEFLSTALFGTRRGFYIDVVPNSDSPAAQAPLPDLRITTQDIASLASSKTASWLYAGEDGAQRLSFKDLTTRRAPGTFLDTENGVVALFMPSNARVQSLRGQFRQFAVAGDHLIGALKPKGGGLLLLARARVVSLDRLPPLRFETLESLANSLGQPLGQSYERQRIFAGNIAGGQYADWDWAPIYLSPQLQDTEFGMLLNLADQQLKSWSQCSQVRYATFDYPAPTSYPFGDLPASDWIFKRTGSPSLIFNWNTRGFAVAADTAQGRVVSASGTAALPVSYIVPDEDNKLRQMLSRMLGVKSDANAAVEASGIGSDYFAQLGDPLLARVVQNVLLYQVIGDARPFQIPAAKASVRPAVVDRSQVVVDLLEGEAAAWLQNLLVRPGITVSAADGGRVDLRKATQDVGLGPKEMAVLLASPQRHAQRMIKLRDNIELKRTSAMQLVERATTVAAEVDVLGEKSDAAFVKACRNRNGSIRDKPSPQGTMQECSYKTYSGAADLPYRDPYADAIQRLKIEQDGLEAELKSVDAGAKASIQSFLTLRQQSKLADAVGGELRQRASHSTDLNAVLERVMAAARNSPSRGSTQTPSVVLSRNLVEEDAVGGHNIDGLPLALREGAASTQPTLRWVAEKPTLVLPKEQMSNGAQAARSVFRKQPMPVVPDGPLADKLMVPEPSGKNILSLLAERGRLPEPSAELLRNAELCACDVYVQRMDANTTSIVRRGPPVVTKVVFGDAVLIDELAGAANGKRVVMAGFTPTRASAVGEGALRLASVDKAETGFLGDAIDRARLLFSQAGDVAHAVTQRLSTRAGNTVHVTAEGVADIATARLQLMKQLAERPDWKAAKTASGGSDLLPGVPLVEIQFQSGRGGTLEAMKISVHDVQGNPVPLDVAAGVARSELARLANLKQSLVVQDVARDMTDRMFRDLKEAKRVDIYLRGVGSSQAIRLERQGNTWVALAGHGY